MKPALVPVLALTLAAIGGGRAIAQDQTGEAVPVPSGQVVTLQDVISDVAGPEGLTLRFRFIAPAIGAGDVAADAASADMQHLCDSYALPRVSDFGPVPSQIVISLSAAPVAFGASAPDVVQFFESYSIDGGKCRWEMF